MREQEGWCLINRLFSTSKTKFQDHIIHRIVDQRTRTRKNATSATTDRVDEDKEDGLLQQGAVIRPVRGTLVRGRKNREGEMDVGHVIPEDNLLIDTVMLLVNM